MCAMHLSKNWPCYLKQQPSELAKAGLFYDGEVYLRDNPF